MTDLVWHTTQLKINELSPFEGNPRQMTDQQAIQLKASLQKFNLVEIPAVNTNGKILAGHQRLKIMQLLGRGAETIDVRVPNRLLTPEEEKEYLLRSNKNTGEWNWDELANFDEEVLKNVGFTKEELEKGFGFSLKEEKDEVPEPPAEARARHGQIFMLGKHRVMCGDSTNAGDVALLMDGKKADIVFTDPPYGVSYGAKNEFLNAISPGNRIQTPIENDQKNEDDIQEFWFKAFEVMRDVLADVSSYYITGPQIQGMMMMMMMMMMKAGIPYRHVIIWVKNNHVLGRCDYNYKHEPLFFGWNKTHKFYGNGEFKTSVWTVDKPHKSDLHPTMKPIRLIVNALLNSSLRDQICFDPFGGSGSTLMACEQTGRECRMMEISESYCDVIIQRYCDFTGADKEKIYESAITGNEQATK